MDYNVYCAFISLVPNACCNGGLILSRYFGSFPSTLCFMHPMHYLIYSSQQPHGIGKIAITFVLRRLRK